METNKENKQDENVNPNHNDVSSAKGGDTTDISFLEKGNTSAGSPNNEQSTTAGIPTPNPADAVSEPEIEDISEQLSEKEKTEEKQDSDAPIEKETKFADFVSKLPIEQIQQLQDILANTPRKKEEKVSYHTIELRQIDGKIVVAWGKSRLELRRNSVENRDEMKTIIPVFFHGEKESKDLLWREEFMQAERVTCKVLDTRRKDKQRVVGKTFKRDERGGFTSQEVEMYVNEVETEFDVLLPNGEKITINGEFANQ